MKKCKNCNKSFKKHPNAKFCSNKGVGNCKDAYHNSTNPRGIAEALYSHAWLSDPEEWGEDDHPFSQEAVGQF